MLEIYIVLCEYIIVRGCNWTLKSKPHSSYHSYQQQQTSNNQQIRMYTILCNTQISYRRSCFSIFSPKRIVAWVSIFILCRSTCQTKRSRQFRIYTFRKRLPKSLKSTKSNTKCQNTSYWVSTTLMCQNFSRRNILKHYNKQKQNSQCSYINQLL